MNVIRWFMSLVSNRGKALARYRAGMAKADRRDFPGAIADYTEAIEMAEIPSDVKAMAIYNRALAYYAIDQHDLAAADLKMVLSLPRLPEDVKSAALRRQERIRKREKRDDEHSAAEA